MYRRFLGGGSVAAATAFAPRREASRVLAVPGGRPRRLPVGVRRGVGVFGAIMDARRIAGDLGWEKFATAHLGMGKVGKAALN